MKKFAFSFVFLLFIAFGCSDDKDSPIPVDIEEPQGNGNEGEEQEEEEEAEEQEEEEEVVSVDPSTIEPQETPPPTNNEFTYEVVVDDLVKPWGMVFLPNGSMLITEITGELIHFENGVKTTVQNAPDVDVNGQGGLLDIELHPDYETNGWIYISYASSEGEGSGSNTAIMRARLQESPLALVDNEVLYKATPNTSSGNHYAGRIDFDNEGYLYFSIGDRGNLNHNPQSIIRDGGKIYRLNDDGSIPSDNPFVGMTDAKEAIYSFGHRNPQGMLRHPVSGKIWTHEHGPRGGDEINIIEKGVNYGWPVITYGIDYDGSNISYATALPGMEQPIHYWVPSIAPSGMTFVTSDNYTNLNGSLLVGSLRYSYLERLLLDSDNNVTSRERLLSDIGRVRNVRQGPDGFIYVAVENLGIVRLIEE